MSIINSKRLRDYPRLFFIAAWIIVVLNLIFRQGWSGLLRQIIGSDFVTLYSAGLLQRIDPANLYNFIRQAEVQQALIQPTPLPGVNPFISPPYVAAVYSLFTYMSLPLAIIIWSLLSLVLTLIAVRILHYLLPKTIMEKLGFWQLSIIVLSFFPIIEGFQAGQNHTLTLLLVTTVILFNLSERWFLAGVMAGFMIYKPQFVLGFLIIWLVWRKSKALIGFVTVSVVEVGSYFIINGISPFLNYLKISQDLVLLPFIPGFPGYLLLTPYGLLSTIFPMEALPVTRIVTVVITIVITIGLIWLAFRLRNEAIKDRIPALVLAILFPLVTTPYALLHDLIIIIPGLIIWARFSESRILLYTTIVVYLGGLFLTLLSLMTKLALTSFIPVGLIILVFLWVFTHRDFVMELDKQ